MASDRAFEAFGIERRHPPLLVYQGAVGEDRHHVRLKLPIAVGQDRTVFVYADPGYETDLTGALCTKWKEREST